jgi:hypothetical protein
MPAPKDPIKYLEWKKNIGASQKGKTFSESHKKKIGDAQRGKKNHMYGKKQTEEHRRKNSEALKGRKMSKSWCEKLSKRQMGEKNSQWKGGITPLCLAIRACLRYREWRDFVFQRDDYTCQMCTKRGGLLHVDHIKPFIVILRENNIKTLQEGIECEEFWNINNGRTLCPTCHRKTETYGNNSKSK